MIFSKEQAAELRRIIQSFHAFFIGNTVGRESLDQEDFDRLESAGFDASQIPVEGAVDEMFAWGMLSLAIERGEAENMDYDEFRRRLQAGEFLPLSFEEQAALESVRNMALSDIRGLGNKVVGDFEDILIEADDKQRERTEDIIRSVAERTIAMRRTAQDMKSDLGHATGDWSRDWSRIADYISQKAYQDGRAAQYERFYGKNVMVYKQVFKGACKHCVRLYTTKGIGSKPKIFKLSKLKKNGTNIGRKTKDWKPVVGPTHPWCRCELNYIDTKRYKWDKEKGAWKLKDKLPPSKGRDIAPVYVTIDGKTKKV